MAKCKQCGHCCKSYYIELTSDDLERWEEDGEFDILEIADTRTRDGFWVKGGDEPYPTPDKACPFLMYQPRFKRYVCRINHTKPEVCRDILCDEIDSKS